MTIEIALLLSIVSVGFSIFFGFKNNRRSDNSEIERQVAENTRMNTKLDMISQNTNDIKAEMRNMNTKIENHNERIIILEQSCKSAHKRLDDFGERLNKDDE